MSGTHISVSDQTFFNLRLIATLDRLQSVSGTAKSDFLDLMGVDSRTELKIRNGLEHYPIYGLADLCKHFGLSLDCLFRGTIDFTAFARQYAGDKLALPEKYANPSHKAAKTRARAVMNVLNYLNKSTRPDASELILRSLQVHPEYFSNAEEYVSPFLISDFLQAAYAYGIPPTTFKKIGINSKYINGNEKVGEILSRCKTPKQLYEQHHADVISTHYDHLFDYEITRLTDDELVFVSTPSKTTHDIIGVPVFGDRQTCLYRQGLYSGLLTYIQQRPSLLKEEACVYRGDAKCIYRLTWPYAPELRII